MMLAALFVLDNSAFAAEPCVLKRMALIDAGVDGSSHVFIPSEVAGRKTNLMVDTGGAWSLIKGELADELKLERRISHDKRLVDASGSELRDYVRVKDLKLGDLTFRGNTDFFIMTGNLGRLDTFGGTVGLNIIARFDLELDPAAKKIGLFHPDHCPGIGAYWAAEWIELPLINSNGLPETRVEIGGKKARALIDTGSTRTFMDTDMARRVFDLTPSSPGVAKSGTLTLPSGKTSETYTYTFATLVVSGFTFENVEVVLHDSEEVDLTLGMRELNHLHLYFAFKEKMLYATTANARR